jgi:5-oxoprolinase (ATP-hydrolysing) subunit A
MIVDLNCDMGEGFGVYRLGDDAEMLTVATSANIACGFHAGDPLVPIRASSISGASGGGRSTASAPPTSRRRSSIKSAPSWRWRRMPAARCAT